MGGVILWVLFLTVLIFILINKAHADWFVNVDNKNNVCEYLKEINPIDFSKEFLARYDDDLMRCSIDDYLKGKRVVCLGLHNGTVVLFFDDLFTCNRAVRRVNKVVDVKADKLAPAK